MMTLIAASAEGTWLNWQFFCDIPALTVLRTRVMTAVTCVQVAEATAKQIEAAAAAYKPCSVRAAILYFVLNDLAGVDPMYQFSLDAYNDLFLGSIQKSAKSDKLEERIKSLNDFHTYAVYKNTSRCVLHRVGNRG